VSVLQVGGVARTIELAISMAVERVLSVPRYTARNHFGTSSGIYFCILRRVRHKELFANSSFLQSVLSPCIRLYHEASKQGLQHFPFLHGIREGNIGTLERRHVS
jgi:hypothetical protein